MSESSLFVEDMCRTSTVTDAYTDVHEVLIYLTIDGEELTTPEHPFLQADGAWTPAGKLAVGNQIRRADGEYGHCQSDRIRCHAAGHVQYDRCRCPHLCCW